MKGIYNLADVNVEVNSVFEQVHQLLRDYKSENPPDFSVTLTREDAYREAEKNACDLPYLEELAVYRKIAERLPFYNVILFHGSAVAVDGAAYLFTAKSGTVKSTHTNLWREMFGARALMVNDDKPLIRLKENGEVLVYGTPYDGKHHLSNPVAAPLKAICLLNRGEKNRIEPLSIQEAFPALWVQAYRPRDGEAYARTLDLLRRISEGVTLYRLFCNQEPEAARVAYQAMGPKMGEDE